MICTHCGSKAAFVIFVKYDPKKGRIDSCNRCSNTSVGTLHDVYWPGGSHYNDNICDAKTGKPIELTSRGQKARVMREQGLSEAGDFYHGSRCQPPPPQRTPPQRKR